MSGVGKYIKGHEHGRTRDILTHACRIGLWDHRWSKRAMDVHAAVVWHRFLLAYVAYRRHKRSSPAVKRHRRKKRLERFETESRKLHRSMVNARGRVNFLAKLRAYFRLP